jgi:DNA-binding transcriptional MerR regulator
MAKPAAGAPRHPIRVVARLTGLSLDTLRAWERRYGAVAPDRSDRGRTYSDADVARLRRLAALVGRGHAIGTIARVPDGGLEALLAGAAALDAQAPAPRAAAGLDQLLAALDRYDLEAIEAILDRHAAVLLPRDLVFSVVLPLLREVGVRWQRGRLRPSQEHLISGIVRSVLGGLVRAMARPGAPSRVVFATPPGERHELGLLSAALLTASAGHGVIYLGADVPAADVVHAAATTGARIVVMSATTAHALTRQDARVLSRLPPGIELWAGGPQASGLRAAVGEHVRIVADLEDVVPLLSHHAP